VKAEHVFLKRKAAQFLSDKNVISTCFQQKLHFHASWRNLATYSTSKDYTDTLRPLCAFRQLHAVRNKCLQLIYCRICETISHSTRTMAKSIAKHPYRWEQETLFAKSINKITVYINIYLRDRFFSKTPNSCRRLFSCARRTTPMRG